MQTNPNPFREALSTIREELKDYARIQRVLKGARKIPVEDLTPELREQLGLPEWGIPALRVISNRGRITALLNFYPGGARPRVPPQRERPQRRRLRERDAAAA